MVVDTKLSKHIQMVGTILMICAICAVFYMGLAVPTDDVRVTSEPRITIEGRWLNAENRQVIEANMIKVPVTESIQITRVLPDNIGDGEILCYFDSGFHVIAYVDGRNIYESGLDAFDGRGKEIAANWRMIPLDASMSEGEIIISFENDTDTELTIDLDNMYIGAKSDVMFLIIKTDVIPLICTSICFILSILFLAFAPNLKRLGLKTYINRVKYLGLLTFFMGLWIYADSSLMQILFNNGSIRYYLNYFAFIIAPLTLNAFYQEVLEEDYVLFRIMSACYKIAIALCLFLYLFGVIHFSNMNFLIHSFLLTMIVLIGYEAIKQFRIKKNEENVAHLVAFLIMVWFVSYGIYIFYFEEKRLLSVHIGIGYVLYLLVISATQVRYIVNAYRLAQKQHDYYIMASLDSTTGGKSNLVAKEWLERDNLFAKGKPWMVHMNLLKFGTVNVSLGWEYGNEILKGIYGAIEECIDEEEELVVYLGNANFAFILSADKDVEIFCKEVDQKVQNFIDAEWMGLKLGIKYAAKHLQKGATLETAIDHLQMAYNSPLAFYSEESNCYYYTEACEEQLKKEYLMENQIGAAVYNDEFRLYLQVLVEPKTNEVIGAEALARWDSPMFGILYPETFIPIAEKSSQIRVVDLHIFKTLLKYMKEREKKGLPELDVSVNISETELTRENFLDDYRKIIEETGFDARRIAFEISESLTSENLNMIKNTIDQIHEMNCCVFMDNFGASSSNLNVITQLHFDYVKLNRNFLQENFENDKNQQNLVKGVIDMFHTMDIKVIGQGVENRKQRDILRELGIDLIQGYFYSKPVDMDNFEAARFLNPVE